MPIDPVRNAAIDVLLRVFEHGVFLDASIDKTLRRRDLRERGRRFLTQLSYGTVRHRMLCDYVLGRLLHQPLAELPAPLRTLLRMGVFQALFCNQVTLPALVHTSVDLARKRGHAGLARLTNAVLRRAPQRLEDVSLPEDPVERLSIRFSMPQWLVNAWAESHGIAHAEELCSASNVQAPVSVRVNSLRTTPTRLAEELAKSGVLTEKRTSIPEELTFLEGPPPARSKRFRAGDFMVQDPASMLAPHLLEPQPGQWILDMCAAPGGKTTHLAALTENGARIVACDSHPGRLRQIRENRLRMGHPGVAVMATDGRRAPFSSCFDRVLVDAPCSGLGTLRRHPDLKYRIAPQDIPELAALQSELLRSAVGVCKNQGVIVYSVCTFSPEETDAVTADVLENEPVKLEDGPTWMDIWKTNQGTYRTSPARDGLDGFFLIRLRKQS